MSEGSSSPIPALPGPVVKVICSCLPIVSRCEARLVSRTWRIHAGEAVNTIAVDQHQLRKQVFADFTAHQVTQQLRKAAAAEAAAAGAAQGQIAAEAAAAGAAQGQIAAAAADVTLSHHLQPQPSASSSNATGLRNRRGRRAAGSRQQHRRAAAAAAAQQQRQLNELHILALSRRLAAAFPGAVNALVLLDVGGYGPAAAPDPADVARKLLLLLSQCKQLARLRLHITVTGGNKKQHEHEHDGGQQQQPQQQQQQQGGANAGPAGLLPLPAWVQQQPPVAAALAAAQLGQNDLQQDDNDDEDILGFDPEDSEYCYGWTARLLQHLQQQQQGLGFRMNADQASSSSSVPPAVQLKRQLLQPVLIWKQSDLQQQRQQPWSQDLLSTAASSSRPATPGSGITSAAASAAPAVPLVLEVCFSGAAYPRDAADWQQLCGVSSAASLLLPEHRPALLPGMIKQGLAGLTQLRALQLSVDAGYSSTAVARLWGVDQSQCSSISLTSLGHLTRLTHLALHTHGCSMRDITAAVINLTALRALCLSGSSMLFLPAVIPRLTQLQLLVLQQQVSLHELDLITMSCPRLKYLESLGVIETAGAAQNLLPYQFLLPTTIATEFLAAAAAAAGTLLGPGADSLSQHNPQWLSAEAFNTFVVDRSVGGVTPASTAVSPVLTDVAAAFYAELHGDAGRAAAEAAKLMRSSNSPIPTSSSSSSSGGGGGGKHMDHIQIVPPGCDPAAAAAGSTLQPVAEQQCSDPCVQSVWWCQLLSAQDDLKQAVLAYFINKLHMNDRVPHLILAHSRDSTPAVSTVSLLQLATAAAHSAEQAAVTAGVMAQPGTLVLVREDHMPAGAVAELLDRLLCASPLDPPSDPTEEQQHHDLAAEQAALQRWKTQQHCNRTEQNILTQQQGQAEGSSAAAEEEEGAAAADGDDHGYDEEATAAAAAQGTAPAPSVSHVGDMGALLSRHVDWESCALQLQQWLQDRYSTGPHSSSSSTININATTSTSSSESSRPPGVQHVMLCVGDGGDMSVLCPSLPALEHLVLAVPPCIASFKTAHTAPTDAATLPQLQLWMGHSRDLGLRGDSIADTAAAASGGGDSGGGGSRPSDEDGAESTQSSGGAVETQAARDEHAATGKGCQQQQQQWHDLVTKEHGSFSGSFLAQQRQALSLHTKASSSSSSSSEQVKPQPSLVVPRPLLPPSSPSPSCYFSNLRTLTISNLSRHDVPWEPSASLGDAVVAAAALGCPALQRLELSGILRVTGGGLLLLRRCAQLKALRLEQWTNTIMQLSSQQYPLPVCCLPHGLTSLILINVQPIAHIHPLAAVAAALEAAGREEGIAAAAQTEAVAAAWRGAAAVDVAAVTAAAKAVAAAAAHGVLVPGLYKEGSTFLGLGIAGRRKSSPAAAAAAEPAANLPHGGSSRSSSRMLIGSRNWFTPEALALLLLDTFFGSGSSVEQSLAQLCCSCCWTAGCHHAYCGSGGSSSNLNCLSSIFSRLEDLTIVAHGPSFEAHRSQHTAAAAGGLDPFLAAGLPHAESLKSLHVTAPGAFSSVPGPAALLYGALSSLSSATAYGAATALTAAAAAALRSGALDSNANLRQRSRRLLTAITGGSDSSGATACGSLSSSYQWLSDLGGCPMLRDVHLDLPLMMPGQLAALVSAVSGSSSITSLSLHGLVINLYSTHTQLLHTIAQLKPTTTKTTPAAAASADPAVGDPAALEASTLLTEPPAAAADLAEVTDISTPSSNAHPNPLRRVDISLTKHTLLPPVGLSLSRTWAAVKAQRHAVATAGELALLQQLRGVLTAAQHHIIAAQGGGGGGGGVAAGLAVPGNAVGAVMNLAMQVAGGGGDGDNQQQVMQLAQLLEQLAAGAGQPPQQQQPAAAPPPQPAAAGGAPQPAAAANAAAAEPAAMDDEQQQQQQGGPLGLINSLLMAVDHQIHMIQYHGPAAAAPYIMTHAAAASSANKEFARVLQRVLISRGVTDCSVRLHGSRVRDRAVAGHQGGHGEDGGAGCSAAAAGWGHRDAGATDSDDDSEGSDYSDSQDVAAGDDPDTVAENTSHPGAQRVQSLAPDSLPELTVTFWDHTGISGASDTLGSGLMVAFSSILRGMSALGPRIQHAKFPGARLAFQAWRILRSAFIGSAVTMLLITVAVVTYFGWDDGLGVGMFHSRLGQQQQQHDEESLDGDWDHVLSYDDDTDDNSDENASLSWVEDKNQSHSASDHRSDQGDDVMPAQHDAINSDTADSSSSSSTSDQDSDEEHDHAGQAADEAEAQAPAAAAEHQPPAAAAAAAAAGPMGVFGLDNIPIPGGNAGMEFIEQSIHDLLNPDGELLSLEGVDESGGTSGVPPQVQVVGQLDSAASVNFILGAAPVCTCQLLLGAWLLYTLYRLAWVCMRSLLRVLMQLW